MLTIRTHVGISKVHGVGLFASERLSTGTCIWIFEPAVDFVYSPAEWENLKKVAHSNSFETLSRYVYKQNGMFILCVDNAQFMNHSNDPNTTNIITTESDIIVANRDIEPGEELLCDYREYSDSSDPHLGIVGGA